MSFAGGQLIIVFKLELYSSSKILNTLLLLVNCPENLIIDLMLLVSFV